VVGCHPVRFCIGLYEVVSNSFVRLSKQLACKMESYHLFMIIAGIRKVSDYSLDLRSRPFDIMPLLIVRDGLCRDLLPIKSAGSISVVT
jgi:hypothetical protein